MIINHNIAAMNTHRQLTGNTLGASKSLEKLSSGLRINRAGDDAAGLAISEKMRAQIRGLDMATKNSQDGISLIQTAEGALGETHNILQRMRQLAVQSASDTNTADDRSKLQSEMDQLAKEITRISNTTEFNTQNLLAGGFDSTFHIGANSGQNITLSIGALDASTLGVAADKNLAGTFTAAGGLASSNIGNLGSGLAAANYSVVMTATTASAAATTNTAGAATTGGTYTGARDQTVLFRVDAVDAPATGKVTAASYSADGGVTWSAATIDTSGANGVISYNGATISVATNAGNAVGNMVTASFTAAKNTFQLTDGSTNIGSAVTAYSDQTSITIGDAGTGRTIEVKTVSGGTKFGSFTAGTAVQAVVKHASESAVTQNGKVTKEAVTQAGIDISTQKLADNAITTINNALETVSSERSKLGALQNRLEHTINNLGTASENLSSAEARIRDVDMAKEMMEFTKNNILTQAAQAMLAQANQQPQGVLQLLR